MSTLYYNNPSSPDVVQILVTASFVEVNLVKQVVKKAEGAALKTNRGLLKGSNTIVKYLAVGHKIAGETEQMQTAIDGWLEHFNRQLHPILKEVRTTLFGIDGRAVRYQYAISELNRQLKILDECLSLKTFFAGNCLSVFDLCLCAHLDCIFRLILTEDAQKKLKNLTRWFIFVRNLGPFQSQMGKTVLCGPNAFQPIFSDAQQQEKTEQIQKKKQQPKPSQKKKQKDQSKPIKAEESKQEEGKEPEAQNGFKLDDFKRSFSNCQGEERKIVVANLLQNFPDGWSIWKIHYEKDVTEGKVDYLTKNLARGTLERLSGLQKKGFGSWGVYQAEAEFQIRGVMMWQGTEVAQQWRDHPAKEYHIFTKLNPQEKQSREIINQYWLKEEKAEGLPLFDAKYLK